MAPIERVIIVWSKYSPQSIKLVRLVQQEHLNIDLLRVDTKRSRQLMLMNSITRVPALVIVYEDGNKIMLNNNKDIYSWLTKQIQQYREAHSQPEPEPEEEPAGFPVPNYDDKGKVNASAVIQQAKKHLENQEMSYKDRQMQLMGITPSQPSQSPQLSEEIEGDDDDDILDL